MVDMELLSNGDRVQITRRGSQNSVIGYVVDITDDPDYPIEVEYYIKKYEEYEQDCFREDELELVDDDYDWQEPERDWDAEIKGRKENDMEGW